MTRYFVTEGEPHAMDVVATGSEGDRGDLEAAMAPGQTLWRAEPEPKAEPGTYWVDLRGFGPGVSTAKYKAGSEAEAIAKAYEAHGIAAKAHREERS